MAAELANGARRRRRPGMTVIELLVALMICSTMLTALVSAIRATVTTVSSNESYARTTIKGRNVLVRMIGQIRTADAHVPYTTSGAAYLAYVQNGQPMSDVGIHFADAGADGPDAANTVEFYYWWDQTKQQVLVQKSVGGAVVASGIMLDGVSNFQVTLWPGKSNAMNATYDVMLRATFMIQYRDTDPANKAPQTLTLSGSVVPRKNGWSGHKLVYPVQTYLDNNY